MKIDVTGLDKLELAIQLYQNALEPYPTNPPVVGTRLRVFLAQRLEKNKFVDEVFGRVIRVDFSGDTLDMTEYERVNGIGTFEKTVSEMKAKKSAWNFGHTLQATVTFLFLALIFGSCTMKMVRGDSQTCLSARSSENAAKAVGAMALESGDYETIRSAKGDLESAMGNTSEACN